MSKLLLVFSTVTLLAIIIFNMPYIDGQEKNNNTSNNLSSSNNFGATKNNKNTTKHRKNIQNDSPYKIKTANRKENRATNENQNNDDTTKFSRSLLAIEYHDDPNWYSEEGLSKEIESIEELLDRYGVIEELNSNSYSEAEREEVNEAIAYLNKLRLVKIDNEIKKIRDNISNFREDIEKGKYPDPQPLPLAKKEEIKRKHMKKYEDKNRIVQEKINELLARTDQDALGELGLH